MSGDHTTNYMKKITQWLNDTCNYTFESFEDTSKVKFSLS